jgi:hypothetical protein
VLRLSKERLGPLLIGSLFSLGKSRTAKRKVGPPDRVQHVAMDDVEVLC